MPPAATRTTTPPTRLLLALGAPTLAVLTAVSFFWTYALDDAVGPDDHRVFLTRVAASVVVLGLVLGLAVAHDAVAGRAQALVATWCLLTCFTTAGGAAYAALLVLPPFDAAVGSDASAAACLAAALSLGLTSGATWLVGRRLLRAGFATP